MNIDKQGLMFLESCEGKKHTRYADSGGAPTIGIGHLLTRSELTSGKIRIVGDQHKSTYIIKYQDGITDDEAYMILKQDLIAAESDVRVGVKVPLTQCQYNALVSFAFNIGSQAFLGSTLLKLLNMGKYTEVPTQLRRWIKDNGKVCQGLVNRREKDILMWNGKWTNK